MRQQTVIKNLLQSVTEVHYTAQQVLQSVAGWYFKVRQVLVSVTVMVCIDL